MKRIMLVGAMIIMSQMAFSQDKVKHDPSYSVNNYKHPNKAAYAKEHNLDNSIALQTASVKENRDYKHPHSKDVKSDKPAFVAKKASKSTVSYKHPFGL